MKRSIVLAAAPVLLAGASLGIALVVAPAASALSQTTGQATGHDTLPPIAAGTCHACHGPSGISAAANIPNLAGQKAVYLEAQLKAFKSKARTNAFMNPIAGQLSDGDIHALALYWASLPATPVTVAAPVPVPSAARLPASFPAGFTQYQDLPGKDGTRTKRFANAVALKAAKAGLPLPDGAIIVGVDYDKDGAVTSSESMEARAGWNASLPPLLRNGNFQYGVYDKAGQPTANFNQAACLACHKGREADSFMFSHQALVDAKS